jgi:hypothetical protein
LLQAGEVLIGLSDGDHVLLQNWRHAPEGWTYADAEIRCGPWQGRIRVSFYSGELIAFADEIRTLYRQLGGKATLRPIEPHLTLTLTGDGRGGIEVDGTAEGTFGMDTQLCFHFSIDQTFLLRIADGLAAAKS